MGRLQSSCHTTESFSKCSVYRTVKRLQRNRIWKSPGSIYIKVRKFLCGDLLVFLWKLTVRSSVVYSCSRLFCSQFHSPERLTQNLLLWKSIHWLELCLLDSQEKQVMSQHTDTLTYTPHREYLVQYRVHSEWETNTQGSHVWKYWGRPFSPAINFH